MLITEQTDTDIDILRPCQYVLINVSYFAEMFSSKSDTKQSPGKKSTTYVSSPSGGGAMARERPRDQSEASCPSCCLTPAKFFRASTHLIKLLEVALGGVCWYLLWVYGKE